MKGEGEDGPVCVPPRTPPSPGTCTNNRRDECRRPGGTMARTCRDMARSWLVSDSSGEGCGEPTGLPPTASPLLPGTSMPAIHPSCPPEPLCELMLSS